MVVDEKMTTNRLFHHLDWFFSLVWVLDYICISLPTRYNIHSHMDMFVFWNLMKSSDTYGEPVFYSVVNSSWWKSLAVKINRIWRIDQPVYVDIGGIIRYSLVYLIFKTNSKVIRSTSTHLHEAKVIVITHERRLAITWTTRIYISTFFSPMR